jgi:hypothetical protein
MVGESRSNLEPTFTDLDFSISSSVKGAVEGKYLNNIQNRVRSVSVFSLSPSSLLYTHTFSL